MSITRGARSGLRFLMYSMLAAASVAGNAYAASVTLGATGGDGRIDLSWAVSGNLRAVQVMRDTDADPSGRQRVAILNGSARSYTDNTVTNGRQYWYWIKFTDTGRTTGNSNAGSATAGASVPSANSTISPGAASFDKNSAKQADIAVSTALNGNTLRAIRNGTATLVAGTDYTVAGSTVTLRRSYLARQALGTISLTFDFSAGTDPVLNLAVADSTVVTVNYTLNMAVSGNGTTSVAAGGHSYRSGTSVSVTAIPASGARFSGWSGAATGNTNPVTITMNGNKSLTAVFMAENSASCDTLDKRLRAATVAVGGTVPESDEYHPVVIAPRSDGSAVLAWSDTSSDTIRLANLNKQDGLVSSLPALSGLEVHAGLAGDDGTTLAIVSNDPDIYSPKYCRSNATPDKNVCGKMDLVHIDTNGTQQFRTTLTNKKNVDSDGAYFIWWYGHTARIATDGTPYGVYFRLAGSSPRPGAAGEVDIHAGDELKFVGLDGALQGGGWDWGCSHSWSVRFAHEGNTWAASCHGDAYPNAMQVARLATPTSGPNDFQWLANTEPTRRALGGLVPGADGFWLNYVDDESGTLALRLARLTGSAASFSTNVPVGSATGIDAGYPFRPYMAAYGKNRLLMGWKSGGRLVLAVADAATGAVVEGPVTTTLNIDQFQDFTTAPNGDVLWAYTAGGRAVTVNRVAACRLE